MSIEINKRKLLVISISVFSIGYIFSIATTSISLFILLFVWILNFNQIFLKDFLKVNGINLLTIYFLLVLIGTSYSLDFHRGVELVVRSIAFIILPLIFTTIKPLKRFQINFVINTFTTCTSVFFIICFLHAIYRQILFSSQGGPFNWYFFYRFDLLELFDQHPTYTSMFTLLSLSFLLFYKSSIYKNKLILVSFVIIQVLGIILYGSRVGYILFFLIFILYAYKNVYNKNLSKKINIILIYIALFFGIIIISWNIPIIKERVLYTFGYNYNYEYNNKEFVKHKNPQEQGRFLLWRDALDIIQKSPFFGYGTGSNKGLLMEKYRKEQHLMFLKREYNTHNTYLHVLLSGGIVLLIVYLSILMTLLYNGIKYNNLVLISFFLILSIVSVTETVFRAQGIAFIAFFYCFLLKHKHEK